MSMKHRNQYTPFIDDFTCEYGINPFYLYRKADLNLQQEIEDWLFQTVRSVNTIPRNITSDDEIIQDLRALSEVEPKSVFYDNSFHFNLSGNLTCREFLFDKMIRVEKSSNMPSVHDSFYNDHRLKRAIRKCLQFSYDIITLLSWLKISGSGYGDNFRPASAKSLYEIFGKPYDCKVIDSSSGWGGRLLGAHFASNVSEYVGTDPNTHTELNKLITFINSHGLSTNTREIVMPIGSEDFTPQNYPEYKNHFDLYFSSPPYFNAEVYSHDRSQSCIKFSTYPNWVRGFLRPTIHNMCDLLNPKGIFLINIFEKVPNIKEIIRLCLLEKGWILYRSLRYLLKMMPGTDLKTDDPNLRVKRPRETGARFEPIFVAKSIPQLLDEGVITSTQANQFLSHVTARAY